MDQFVTELYRVFYKWFCVFVGGGSTISDKLER